MRWTKQILLMAGCICMAAPAGAAAPPSPETHLEVEPTALLVNPQMAWNRAVVFSDELASLPGERRPVRIQREPYQSLQLKNTGEVWVHQDLVSAFQNLAVGHSYVFTGRSEKIGRKYVIILDGGFTVREREGEAPLWTDMLAPLPEGEWDGLTETLLDVLLIDAQNSLDQLAQASGMSVAELIHSQPDGGQQIAKNIVADTLKDERPDRDKTAEELMLNAVLALLSRQAEMRETTVPELEEPPLLPPVPHAPPPQEQMEDMAAVIEEETAEVPVPDEEGGDLSDGELPEDDAEEIEIAVAEVVESISESVPEPIEAADTAESSTEEVPGATGDIGVLLAEPPETAEPEAEAVELPDAPELAAEAVEESIVVEMAAAAAEPKEDEPAPVRKPRARRKKKSTPPPAALPEEKAEQITGEEVPSAEEMPPAKPKRSRKKKIQETAVQEPPSESVDQAGVKEAETELLGSIADQEKEPEVEPAPARAPWWQWWKKSGPDKTESIAEETTAKPASDEAPAMLPDAAETPAESEPIIYLPPVDPQTAQAEDRALAAQRRAEEKQARKEEAARKKEEARLARAEAKRLK
ncbi:MAG: hypothetical protein GX548_06490, partial [Lentisphaerae bacterium]|nr:hypothetical protein [Lentisphaerota bacterium]